MIPESPQDPFLEARRPRIAGRWWLVLVGGLIMTIATLPVDDATGVWSLALQTHFGWSTVQLAPAFGLTSVLGILVAPLVGYLTDRIGTRRTVLFGLAILGGSWILFSFIGNLRMLYATYVLFTVGLGLAGWIPLTTMLLKWFVRRRGLAVGCFQVVSGLGGGVLLPVIAWSIDPLPGRAGWQITALTIAVGILLLAWPLTRLLHNDPRDYGVEPDGGGPPHPELTAPEALRSRAFWLISLGNCFILMAIVPITTQLGLLMEVRGFSIGNAGLVFSAYTGVATFSYLVGGYAGDLMSKRVALALFATFQAAGVLALVVAQNLPMFYLFAVLFGAGMGGNGTLAVVILADYFGMKSFGKILGLSSVLTFLALIAPAFVGIIYDEFGTHTPALLVLAGLTLTAALCYLAASPPKPRGTGAGEAVPAGA